MNWEFKYFSELSVNELYDVLRLRSEVFVVEQQCIFLDMDDKDQSSWHLLGYEDGQLAAYTRIVPKGIAYDDYHSIGRVVTASAVRGRGVGVMLMQQSIERVFELFGPCAIKIGAQCYLLKFYKSLGFETMGEIYLEDGIEHIHMLRMPN